MNRREPNIDFVFRNGLNDYEILPPAEIWENIHPVLRRIHKPFIMLRVAAAVVIILSMSFLAYRLGTVITPEFENDVLALGEEPAFIENSPVTYQSPAILIKENELAGNSQNIVTSSAVDSSEIPQDNDIFSHKIVLLKETEGLWIENSSVMKRTQLAKVNATKMNIVEVEGLEESFLPPVEDVKVTDRWSIAALASPTYYSRFNSGNDEVLDQLLASEQPIVSYTGGVAFSYKINKRFSIQSGLFYSSIGQEVGGISSYGGFQNYNESKGDPSFEVMTTRGTIYTNNPDVFLRADGPDERIMTNYTSDVFNPEKASLQYINDNLLQNFSYLELPLILRYKLIDKMIDFNLIGGVSYNMLVNNSVYTLADGGKQSIGKTDGLNLFSLSSSFGMGMEYNFSENLSLNLEPTFRYYLNPFNQLSVSGTHPYSFGIFSGVSYKF